MKLVYVVLGVDEFSVHTGFGDDECFFIGKFIEEFDFLLEATDFIRKGGDGKYPYYKIEEVYKPIK